MDFTFPRNETFERIAVALEGMGASAVPKFSEETGRYDNASIAAWLAKMRDGKNYGVSIPKGSSTACTKTGANAGSPHKYRLSAF